MTAPICPDDILEGLIDMVDGYVRRGYELSMRNQRAVLLVLRRLQAAQRDGRVLADPLDDRPWDHDLQQDIQKLQGRLTATSEP